MDREERPSGRPAEASAAADTEETLAVLNAIVRHHVRNHLTVIRGRAQWLDSGEGQDNPDVETILRRCDAMADTVDKIETVTKVMRDGTDPDAEPLDLSVFVRAELSTLADQYGLDFESDMPETGPEVRIDDTLALVLRELVDNVATHTDSSTVRVSVSADSEWGHLVVSDAGPGLAPSVVEDPFNHSVRAPDSDGGGLGLFLCRAIVGQHGGRIGFDERDEGVTVRVSLPRAG